jgi:3-hydroxy-3-methylglutaryl CoA synthase
LKGKKILMFSYGSGCAASAYLIEGRADYREAQERAQFADRLLSRTVVAPEEYDVIMQKR